MKKYLILVIIVSAITPSFSQPESIYQGVYNTKKRFFGITLGANLTNARYTEERLQEFKQIPYLSQNIGVFFRTHPSDHFSIKTGFYYTGKGVRIKDGVDYKLRANYIEISSLATLSLHPLLEKKLNPYVTLGPYFAIANDGDIAMTTESGAKVGPIDVTQGNLNPLDIGFKIGLGADYLLSKSKLHIIQGELLYSSSFSNSYGQNEPNLFPVEGKRKLKGFEAKISFLFPMGPWRKKYKVPEKKEIVPEIIEPQKDQLVKKEEPVKVIAEIEEEKSVLTTEEVKTLLSEDKDITGKKIILHSIEFELNKSVLKEGSKQYIDEIVSLMEASQSVKMKITGHTDNSGNDEYNMTLSKARARTVYNYMVEKGISKARLQYDGLGETKPLESNETEEGRNKNRRVEFEAY